MEEVKERKQSASSKVGNIYVKASVDTTEIDSALKKIDEALEKMARLQGLMDKL